MSEELESGTKLKQLAELALRQAEYFKDAEKKVYAQVKIGGHGEFYPVKAYEFENWLSAINYKAFDEVPTNKLKSEVVQYIEGVQRIASPEVEVELRVRGDDSFIEIDLGGHEWQSVYLNDLGWEVDLHKNYFYRGRASASLPIPVTGDDEQDWLVRFFKLSDNQAKLVQGWLLGCFKPQGPYPILILQGEQGSGKSTLASFLRSLVDPSLAEKTSLPNSERDLYIHALNNYVLTFDNQRTIYSKKSDWLCRMSTGGGFSTRRLYTNTEDEFFNCTRPMILNGITHLADEPDLLERALVINLPGIDGRKTEKELKHKFEELKPRIFGQICDLLVSVLGQEDKHLDDLPRMADFAMFVSKAESDLGWQEGSFIKAMKENRKEALEILHESDSFLNALIQLAETRKELSWIFLGTPTDLYQELLDNTPNKAWKNQLPNSPASLSKRLEMLKPVLREKGIRVTNSKSRGKRLKRIEWMKT